MALHYCVCQNGSLASPYISFRGVVFIVSWKIPEFPSFLRKLWGLSLQIAVYKGKNICIYQDCMVLWH